MLLKRGGYSMGMGYEELIEKIKDDAGISRSESKKTLDLMVETISERLDSSERRDFAVRLPEELQEVALTALPAGLNDDRDIVQEFMEKEEVQEEYARMQITAAWRSLKTLIGDVKIMTQIRMFIPANIIAAM